MMLGRELKYGLIGYPLGHSFSKRYYDQKLASEKIQEVSYELFPLKTIEAFPQLFESHPNLAGVNVTIPYKIDVIPYLDALSDEAKEIGAVNCIRAERRDSAKKPFLTGFNTDVFGFVTSVERHLTPEQRQGKALILGTGGASKAVEYGLKKLDIPYTLATRRRTYLDERMLEYQELDESVMQEHLVIINTTPLGMHPNITAAPRIPYEAVTSKHLLYDLIYNPSKTPFLKKGEQCGATILNGYNMLVLQAEKNWEIWRG